MSQLINGVWIDPVSGGNDESMYEYSNKGVGNSGIGRCMVTGRSCDHKETGDCESCCYAG